MTESALGYPLHEDEQILLQLKPNPTIVWAWMCTKLWHVIAVILIACFWVVNTHNISSNTASTLYHSASSLASHHLYIAMALVVILVLLAAYAWLRLVANAYRYVITNQRCFIRYGLISMNTRIIPVSQINDVNITANIVLRQFQLENVFIDTISTAYMSTRRNLMNNSTLLEGLTRAESNEAVTVLTKLMKQKNT